MRYYNDIAQNCTFGVGTLAHLGPCSQEEFQRPVTIADVDTHLAARIAVAERSVRRQVRNHPLTQSQFDALVSFTYNMGATAAHPTLSAANRGANEAVATSITNAVWAHPRDHRGRRLAPVRIQGLVNRRREEGLPFQAPVHAPAPAPLRLAPRG